MGLDRPHDRRCLVHLPLVVEAVQSLLPDWAQTLELDATTELQVLEDSYGVTREQLTDEIYTMHGVRFISEAVHSSTTLHDITHQVWTHKVQHPDPPQGEGAT